MLGDTQIEQVRLVLSTEGWKNVMKPALTRRMNAAIKALCLTRAERAVQYAKSEYDTEDVDLRAMIRDCEWMLVAWDNEVAVYDENRKRDELELRNQ